MELEDLEDHISDIADDFNNADFECSQNEKDLNASIYFQNCPPTQLNEIFNRILHSINVINSEKYFEDYYLDFKMEINLQAKH